MTRNLANLLDEELDGPAERSPNVADLEKLLCSMDELLCCLREMSIYYPDTLSRTSLTNEEGSRSALRHVFRRWRGHLDYIEARTKHRI